MGLTSLQVCMDSSDWLQGTIEEENGMDSSSSPCGGDILTCSSRPLMERRLRPPHDQALKCPRCDSTHTKFCYYNNYSLSQPRYFCKTCRRYWTKGGTLRNIPVGGGCRKNTKKPPSKKSNHHHHHQSPSISPTGSGSGAPLLTQGPTDLPNVQFSHLANFLGTSENPNFMMENPRPIDFMESKYDELGYPRNLNHDFMGNGFCDLGMMSGGGSYSTHDHHQGGLGPNGNFHGLCSSSPFGMTSLDGSSSTGGAFMDTCQRMMLPNYDDHHDHDHHMINAMDVKPNTKLLALEWQDQAAAAAAGCNSDHHAGKDSFGYINGLGSWTGLMNGYGPPTTNPLI